MSFKFGHPIRYLEGSPLGLGGGRGVCSDSSDCYYSNEGQIPYISDVYREFLHDGTRFQDQPMETQYPLIFKLFFGKENIRYIQGVIRSRGFNAVPDTIQLSGFMNQVYTDDMPYGAYNQRDPQRTNRSPEYVRYYVQRLNDQLLTRVLRNMSIMKSSRLQYLRDISGFQGPLEIVRPIYTECKKRGPPLDLSVHLLPPPPDGVQPRAFIV